MSKQKFSLFKILFLPIVTFLYLPLYSATIEGLIKDAKSGEKIAYAYITVEGTSMGTISDSTGYFKLSVLSGKHQLKVSYITHIAQIMPLVAMARQCEHQHKRNTISNKMLSLHHLKIKTNNNSSLRNLLKTL